MTTRFYKVLLAAVLLLVPLAPSVASTLILQNANSNENSLVNGELVSVLQGNVVFLYDSATIRSELAKWWRGRGQVIFSKNVEVSRRNQQLTCHRMTYERSTADLTAQTDVVFVDSSDNIAISGNNCVYNLKTKACVLTGSPHFMRIDTAAAETLTITGRKMVYEDSLGCTTVFDNVVIDRGRLHTECGLAYYYSESGLTMLRRDPRIFYGDQRMRGDSVDLVFRNDTLQHIFVMRSAHGFYLEKEPNDTGHTNVWGDSIAMRLNDSGDLDTVWVVGDARSAHVLTSAPSDSNKVRGRRMRLVFGGQGSVQVADVHGNAVCTYYVENREEEDGLNEASGDSLRVWFDEGVAARLRLSGDVRGTYAPR